GRDAVGVRAGRVGARVGVTGLRGVGEQSAVAVDGVLRDRRAAVVRFAPRQLCQVAVARDGDAGGGGGGGGGLVVLHVHAPAAALPHDRGDLGVGVAAGGVGRLHARADATVGKGDQ